MSETTDGDKRHPSLRDARIIMMKIDSSGNTFGPCANCGDLLDGAWRGGRRAGYQLAFADGSSLFCSPQCVAEHFRLQRDCSAAWRSYEETFTVERWGYWLTNGCDRCKREERSQRYATFVVPLESLWEIEHDPSFCSAACVISAFEEDAEQVASLGLGKWLVPLGDSLPDGPHERAHAAAHLKCLRRKLRPKELARLGY